MDLSEQEVQTVLQAVPETDTVAPEVDASVKSPVQEVSKNTEQDGTHEGLEEDANVLTQSNSKDVEFVKKPGEFTTEVFKIEIRNLPRYAGYKVSVHDSSFKTGCVAMWCVAIEKTAGGFGTETGQDQNDAQ